MSTIKHNWTKQEIAELFELPFADLLYQAQTEHRKHFTANALQLSAILSIKTGACPEDCNYCSQSGHYQVDVEREKLLPVDEVITRAKEAKANAADRFCMGGAWRSPPKKAMPELIKMVKAVKEMGLETCLTAGMLDKDQAESLKEAGLDFYNHNLDTSPEYYDKIVTTRTYQDRLDTLNEVRNAGISVCCGGIMGLGESRDDRVSFIQQLANLEPHPESVPINKLVPFKGTPQYEDKKDIDDLEFVRVIAVARVVMPKSHIRLSAGRKSMNELMQTLCYLAGANSIWVGEKLLTSSNNEQPADAALLNALGLKAETNCCERLETA